MSNIAKLVTITPLIKPQVRFSLSSTYDMPLAPRNTQKIDTSLSDLYDFLSVSELDSPQSDVWAQFSNPQGFHDENGFFPPMDPEEIKQFADKYFSPVSEFSLLELEEAPDLLPDLMKEFESNEIDIASLGSFSEDSSLSNNSEELDRLLFSLSSPISPFSPDKIEGSSTTSSTHAFVGTEMDEFSRISQ